MLLVDCLFCDICTTTIAGNHATACASQGFIGFTLTSQHEFHRFFFPFLFGDVRSYDSRRTVLITQLQCNIHCVKKQGKWFG